MKDSERKFRKIAELGLPLPEAAGLAGMARTNYRKRAEKLGYDVKLGTPGRRRIYEGCSVAGCKAPHHSNNRCLKHFNEWYYRQNSAMFKDRAKRQREAKREYLLLPEQRKRLRENPFESLYYGRKRKAVCLECWIICDDLTHHTPHCPEKPQSASEYARSWKLPYPLVSPKQREAYSQRQRRIWTSFELRSRMARNRWGKGTASRFQTRKVSNRKLLEIVADNPGLSLTEGAALTGRLRRIGFYKRTRRLGDFGAVPARNPRREFVRLCSDPQLRRWIASLPQNFSDEQFFQFCMDNLSHGLLNASQFASFILHLEAELRQRSEWMATIGAEIAARKPAQTAVLLATCIFDRMRADLRNRNGSAEPAKRAPAAAQRKYGPDKTAVEKTAWFAIGRQVEEMLSQAKSVVEARRQVGKNRTCEYGTIVRYHERYRAHLRKIAVDPPPTRLAG